MKITHVCENKPYVKLNDCKMGINNSWVDGVSYKISDGFDIDDQIFTQTKEQFDNNFKEWTPDFSKYIPEDSAVLFLSEEDCEKYSAYIENKDYAVKPFSLRMVGGGTRVQISEHHKAKAFYTEHKTVVIILPTIHTNAEDIYKEKYYSPYYTQEINNIGQELKQFYKVERVEVFVKDCLVETPMHALIGEDGYFGFDCTKTGKRINHFIDQIITTNSTGVLEPQDTERLKVIDWKEWFKDVK
jgi:hypothetical protein